MSLSAWLVACVCLLESASAQQGDPHAGEPFVIERMDTTVRFDNDGTGQRDLFVRVRVQSEAGVQRWRELAVAYNAAHERVQLERLEIIKAPPSNDIVPVNLRDAQDVALPVAHEAPGYANFRETRVSVAALQAGDRLEFQVRTIVHTAVAPGHFWFSHSFDQSAIVLDERLRLDVPSDRPITLYVRAGLESVPADSASGGGPPGPGRTRHAWRASHLTRAPARADRVDTPVQQLRRLRTPPPPAVQLTTFESWEAVARWYAGLSEAPAAAAAAAAAAPPSDAALQEKAAELTRGQTTALGKLEALYEFVAKDIRYMSLAFGMGGYAPRPAPAILASGYGDAKDKHMLLAALARAVDLDVRPVLTHSLVRLDPTLPSPAQFDHVISVMPIGPDPSKWVWLDTTPGIAPFRMLPPLLRGQRGLLVVPAPKGAGTAAVAAAGTVRAGLVTVPKGLPFPATEQVEVTGVVDATGRLDARVTITLRNDAELQMRGAFRVMVPATWREFGDTLANASATGGRITELTPSDPAATREPFQLRYRQQRANFLDLPPSSAAPGTPQAQSLLVPLPIDRLKLPATNEQDWDTTEPVELAELGESIGRVTLELPPGLVIRLPPDVTLKRDYAELRLTYALKGRVVTMERRVRFLLRELPPSRAADYLGFVREFWAAESQRITVERPGAP